jgi:ankyrin repeat protein
MAKARLLLDAGTDIDAATPHGSTALLLTLEHHPRDVDMVRLLLSHGADPNALTRAADAKVAQALINAGADVNKVDEDGSTALMYATRADERKTVRCLIQAGADVDAADVYGTTALMIASRRRDAKMVRVLIQSGADVDAADVEGTTALMYAAKRGDPEIVRVFLTVGSAPAYAHADREATDHTGMTALMHAAERLGHAHEVYVNTEDCASVVALLQGRFRLNEAVRAVRRTCALWFNPSRVSCQNNVVSCHTSQHVANFRCRLPDRSVPRGDGGRLG